MTPIKQVELDSFLGGKLGFEREPSRHIKYELPKSLRAFVPGVFPIQLQHGRGEVSNHIVKQICNFLGLSGRRFSSAQKCDHSQRVIFYSMLVSQMERLARQAEAEPVVYSRNISVYARYIPSLLKNIELLCPATLHQLDRELLQDLDARLVKLKASSAVINCSDRDAIVTGIDTLRRQFTSL